MSADIDLKTIEIVNAIAKDIRAKAESIYERWWSEEFEIDPEKAERIYDFEVFNLVKPDEMKPERIMMKVKDGLTNALTNYGVQRYRGGIRWLPYARNLVSAYNTAKGNGAIVAGSSIKKSLQEREHQIALLVAENQELKVNLTKTERLLNDCREHADKPGVKQADMERRKTAQKQADIRDSMRRKSQRIQARQEFENKENSQS